MALTLEITHINAPRYGNNKTLPMNTHYGYVTLFKGSTVTGSLAIKYPKFRVFDIVNQGIWEYHQATETLVSSVSVTAENVVQVANAIIDRADEGWGTEDICKVLRFVDDEQGFLDSLLFSVLDCDEQPPQPSAKELNQYRAFPIASPFPDVVKFLSDVPLSFLWRLELFYLVNPAVYIFDNPTDTGDQTEGEEEYPEPDGESPFPPSSPGDPDSDPRDYIGGDGVDYPPGTRLRVSYTKFPYLFGCIPIEESRVIDLAYFGSSQVSISFIGSVNGCDGPQTAGGLRLTVPGLSPVELAPLGEQQSRAARIDSVQIVQP
jgi:hypothetical protein